MDLRATECEDVDWIHLAPHRDLWWALVGTETYLTVLKQARNFLSSWATFSL